MVNIIEELYREIEYADRWPSYNSCHEGYAVILEELDELWEHVKTNEKNRNIDAMRQEALQVAASAIRFARDLCDETNGRK